jgi:hypothetical protein
MFKITTLLDGLHNNIKIDQLDDKQYLCNEKIITKQSGNNVVKNKEIMAIEIPKTNKINIKINESNYVDNFYRKIKIRKKVLK